MAEIWPVNLTPADKTLVTKLAERRAGLGLASTYAETIRTAVTLALSADSKTLLKGELS